MSSSDPVADVEPDDSDTKQVLPTVSSPNSFFLFLLMVVAFLVFHRLSWESVQYLLNGRVSSEVLKYAYFLWFIPILGILGSIIVPSLGTTTAWLIGSSSASSVPLFLAVIYTLLFGIRTNPTVLSP